MDATNTTRWIGIGLLGLPLYGALTFWSSMNPQPDPNTHYDAWSRFVTTDHYVWSHVMGSTLGLILAIFGTFALGAYLANGRAGRLGVVAMVITVFGTALFLPAMGVSTFSAPHEGQAYLAGIEEYDKLPSIFAAISFAVGALIFWRKSDDRMALFVALALVTFGALAFVDKLDSVAAGYPALWWPFTLVTFLGNIFPVLFFYVFPDGRFVPRWTLALAISLVVLGVCFHFFPGSPLSRWLTSPPGLVLSVCFIGSAVFAQLYRYWRVSTPAQRQQTKWVVFGATTAMVVTQGVNIAFPLQDRTHVILTLISYTLLYLSLLLIPLSIGVAILRYHLFDINVIINRTLVYGALTASVVLLYVLVVGGLGAVLQVQGSLIVSLIATGLAAVNVPAFA